MALHRIASSFTAPGADLRWDDGFLRDERARLELGRRSDRMTAAVLSALDRLEGRPDDAPLLFGSMLGVQSRITALQNDLIDFPEDQIGPVSFSCSADAVLAAGNAERALVILTEERSAFADRAMRLHDLEPMEFATVFLLERAKEGDERFSPPPELDYFQWIRSLLSV